MTDQINHPPHYGGDTKFEAIKVMELFGLVEDFRLASAYKYLSHCGKKEPELIDLGKALWYLKRYQNATMVDGVAFPVYNGSRRDLPDIGEIAAAMNLENPWAEEALIDILSISVNADEEAYLAAAIGATEKAISLAHGEAVDRPPSRRQ